MNTRHLSLNRLTFFRPSTADMQLKKSLSDIGIEVNLDTGHLYYQPHFKPLSVDFDLVFARHGETYGNCGQSIDGKIDLNAVKNKIKNRELRIFQGDVDDEINQLTDFGKEQALKLAERLNRDFLAKGWKPDIILVSPLKRAFETARPFIELIKQSQIECQVIADGRIKEISFGAWENKRVSDFDPNDRCHDFYRKQHSLEKSVAAQSENFCELLLRAHQSMLAFNDLYAHKCIVMVSHSMFGAALRILFGLGIKVENGEYLAFDGTRNDGTSYTIPNAEPFVLHLRDKNLNFERKGGFSKL